MSGGVWITRTCLEAVQLLDRGKVKKRESVDGQKRKKKKNVAFAGISSAEVEQEQHNSADEAITYSSL